jgi:hypothetical protein
VQQRETGGAAERLLRGAMATPGQFSKLVGTPAKLETASTMSSAPLLAVISAMASRSFRVPDGVSQCTTDTMVTSARPFSASLTAAGATELRLDASTSMTSRANRRAS